jgi:hypothetical protein
VRNDDRQVRHLADRQQLGGGEPLDADPVNAWLATLILAVALDLARAGGLPQQGQVS